jgi:uncharacterized protein (TIGR03083 family)
MPTVVPARDVDCGELYETERRKFVALQRSLDDASRSTPVPATPAWTVHDVLAHVVGITVDLNAGNFGRGDEPDTWTAAQVDARRGRTVEQLAAEWDAAAPQFEDGLRLLGYEIGSHYLGDLLQHAADVRHALGMPRPDDDLSLAVGLDFYLISFEESLVEAGIGAVEIAVGDESWTLGPAPPVASLRAERFELFRALGGRRTAAQIRALTWRGDVDSVVPLVSRYPLPQADLVE